MKMTETTKKIIFAIIVIILIVLKFPLIALGLVFFINIYHIYFFYKKSLFFYKTPYYNKALLGMYVKFLGKIDAYNKLKDPISNGIYEFYKFKIKALWSVKAQSPSKGYITETKPLGMGHSRKPFKVSDSTRSILVDSEIPDGKIGKYRIKTRTTDSSTPIEGYPSAEKYETYRHINNFLEAGDLVTIYGRLIQKEDGTHIITNTKSSKMPFIVFLGDKLKFAAFYKFQFVDKILSLIILTSMIIPMSMSYLKIEGPDFFYRFYSFFYVHGDGYITVFNFLVVYLVFGIISPFKILFD